MYFFQTELWPYGDHKKVSPMVTVVGYNTGRTILGHSDYINYVYDRGMSRETIIEAYDNWKDNSTLTQELGEFLPTGFIRVDVKNHARQSGMTELIRRIMVEYETQMDIIREQDLNVGV